MQLSYGPFGPQHIWTMLSSLGGYLFLAALHDLRASQVVLVLKNPPAIAGDMRDIGSIPGSGRSPGGGHGNPPQYTCLENPMDREV